MNAPDKLDALCAARVSAEIVTEVEEVAALMAAEHLDALREGDRIRS